MEICRQARGSGYPLWSANGFQLLTRLDQAIDKALTFGIFTDEING
jgi:hypothetical protein